MSFKMRDAFHTPQVELPERLREPTEAWRIPEILSKLPERQREGEPLSRFPYNYKDWMPSIPARESADNTEISEKEKDVEKQPEYLERLTAEEIAERQNRVIEDVESGKIQLETSAMKGAYGEMKADQAMRDKGYQRISKTAVVGLDGERVVNASVTSEKIAKGTDLAHGIDGVYEKKEDGHSHFVVADAKFGTARLEENTKNGKQMGGAWIDANLDKEVGKEKADEIRAAMADGNVENCVCRVAKGGLPEDGSKVPVLFECLDENGNKIREDVNLNVA